MWSRRVLLLLPFLLASLVLAPGQPASAAVVAVQDRAQPAAPPRHDLTKGRYFNGAEEIRFRAHLVDLRRTTEVVGFDMLDPKFGNTFYRVRLTHRSGRLMRFGLQGGKFLKCDGLRTTWQPRLDVVTATIPHACVSGATFNGALVMETWSGSDFLPFRTVQRG